MAVVLNTQITLDPGNQIAHLADFTGLEVGTEYVVAGSFLQSDTRFTFLGYFDITLTRPPLSVPAAQTEVPATVSTVPMPAAATPPATYPYTTNDRMVAANLNNAFEFNAAPTPPNGNGGGAGQFNQWIDTTNPNLVTLRQCVVPQAQAGVFNASEWVELSQLNISTKKLGFNGGVVGFYNGLIIANGGASINGDVGVQGNTFFTGNITVTGGITIGNPASLPYVKLTGDVMTGGLTTPSVTTPVISLSNIMNMTDRDNAASQVWATYGQAGVYRLYVSTRGDFYQYNAGNNNHSFIGQVNVGGPLTCTDIWINGIHLVNDGGWLRSGSNLVAPAIQSDSGIVAAGGIQANGGGNSIYAPNGNIYTQHSVIAGYQLQVAGIALGNNAGYLYTGNWFWSPRVRTDYLDTGSIGATGNVDVSGDIIGSGNRIFCGPVGGQMALIRDVPNSRNFLQFLDGWGVVFATDSGRTSVVGPPGQEIWVMAGTCTAPLSYVAGNGAYVNISDVAFKEQVAPATAGLDEILALEPVTFVRKQRGEGLLAVPSRQELGFVAQDVQAVLPLAVTEVDLKEGPALGVASEAIVAAMVTAFKQLTARVEQLEGKVGA